MSGFATFIVSAFMVVPVMAEDNPFLGIRDRYQWAVGEVMAHRAPEKVALPAQGGHTTKPRKEAVPTPQFQAQTFRFQTETDKAKVNVEVTDFGGSFLVDVVSDQVIEGWLLKRQSTRDVFLKGTGPTGNPYQCRIRVDRPYLKDFGLTVYVTEDSDPAFIQLY